MISKDLVVYGAGLHARKVARELRRIGRHVHGFVTSRPGSLQEVDRIPVYCIDTMPAFFRESCQLVCGVFNRKDPFSEIAASAAQVGFTKIVWPWEYYQLISQGLGWCYWLDEQPKSLDSWRKDQNYTILCDNLADEESRVTLDRILSFRSGEDLKFSSFHSCDAQYFNQLTLDSLPSGQPISFMDIGAYDGDTLKSLCSRRPISRALLLEPDPSNYSALSQNLKQLIRDFPGIEPLALPLGAGEEFGSFVMTGEGEAASMAGMDQLDNISGHSVTVVPIDEVMPRACFDFVKIDVEGNDLAALKGMQKLLRRSMPVLAVSLYHRPRDIVELPLAIMAIFREIPYSYYIRQHMSNSFETVLYAVPARQAA